MKKVDYRTLYKEIEECINQWLDSDASDFEFTPYLWVYEWEGEVEAAICDTDEQGEGMYDFESFGAEVDIDVNTGEIVHVIRDEKIHEIVRKWCWAPSAREANNYEIPEIVTEENLVELCERFREAIVDGNRPGYPEINVRYAVRDGVFHLAKFGDYFFFEQKMYVFDQDPVWKPYHDEFAVMATFGNPCRKRGYAHAVAFCGVQTPFCDDNGDPIFTGDICQVPELSNDYHVVTANEFEGYGFKADNCMLLLEMLRKPAHRVGTIFYGLSLTEPMQNTWFKSSEICTMYGQTDDIKEKLKMAKSTPSFGEKVVYNWRRVINPKRARKM